MTRPDPRLLDEPVEGLIDTDPPSWAAIAVATMAALALVILTWSGALFG